MAEEALTDAVVASAAACEDARLRFVFERLVRHLHAFIRDVEPSEAEWLAGIEFLTATGHKSNALRQEFILLSDTLGVTALVDALAHKLPSGATESSVLGPFFTDDAPDVAEGASIASAGKGDPLIVSGHVRDVAGNAIANAIIDVWETDANALYDTQYDDRSAPDCRGRVRTNAHGAFRFGAVVPTGYSIPTDGPVGQLLLDLGRHTFRPAHIHFKITAPGYVPLTTAIYVARTAYLDSDAVFGVKASLVEEFVREGSMTTLKRDFVLAPLAASS